MKYQSTRLSNEKTVKNHSRKTMKIVNVGTVVYKKHDR